MYPGETPLKYISHTSAIYVDLEPSFPKDTAKLEKNLGQTTLRFIFWPHVPENASVAAHLLEGCDVIALEAVTTIPEGVDPESQEWTDIAQDYAKIFDALNLFTALPPSDTADPKGGNKPFDSKSTPITKALSCAAAAKKWADLFEDTEHPYWFLLKGFANSGVAIELLDVGPEDACEADKIDKKSQAKKTSFNSVIRRANLSWAEMAELYAEAIEQEAAYIQFRDNIAASQIQQIAENNRGKTVGILYGKAHNNLTRLTPPQEDVTMQRLFVSDTQRYSSVGTKDVIDCLLINTLTATGHLQTPFVDIAIASHIASDFDPETEEAFSRATPQQLSKIVSGLKNIFTESLPTNNFYMLPEMITRRDNSLKLIRGCLSLKIQF